MRRRIATALPLALLALLMLAGTTAAQPPTARATRPAAGSGPKVAIIVGPTGAATPAYRLLAEAAAQAAERYSNRVVRLYSPYATWKEVRAGLQGASVVVYLGHGNGWPSRYRSSPWPYSQNGLGLNPVAGGGDEAHQYFGEYYLAREVRLAPNAVVVMSRLCYASGNSEPGLPEGTLDVATERVDNFAAGWLAAGARAVVADAFSPPAYYVDALLGGQATVEDMWRSAPTFNGNTLAFKSARTSGFTLRLDPDRETSGFHRSLVSRGRLAAGEVRASAPPGPAVAQPAAPLIPGAASEPILEPPPPPPPTLTQQGFAFGAPALDRPPTSGKNAWLKVPVERPDGRALPTGLLTAVRWDPLTLDPSSAAPDTTPRSGRGAAANVTPTAAARAPAAAAPISPEVLGEVVLSEPVRLTPRGLQVRLAIPAAAGLYRLTVTLSDRDGQPLRTDDEAAPFIAPLLIRVTGTVAAAYGAPAAITVPVGLDFSVPVTVANIGRAAWTATDATAPAAPEASGRRLLETARLGAHWLSLGLDETVEAPAPFAIGEVEPGKSATAVLTLRAPAAPGQYALLLDVITPRWGSLMAAGSAPATIRVTVTAPPPPPTTSPLRPPENPADRT